MAKLRQSESEDRGVEQALCMVLSWLRPAIWYSLSLIALLGSRKHKRIGKMPYGLTQISTYDNFIALLPVTYYELI